MDYVVIGNENYEKLLTLGFTLANSQYKISRDDAYIMTAPSNFDNNFNFATVDVLPIVAVFKTFS